MKNILYRAKKDIKGFVKSNKFFSYSSALTLTFLMGGNLLKANSISSVENGVKNVEKALKENRKENKKKLRLNNLELLQLEEQGDHVVKSPWSSWQFSLGGEINASSKEIKGKGNKKNNVGLFGTTLNRDPWYVSKVSLSSSNYDKIDNTTGIWSASTNKVSDSNVSGLTEINKIVEPVAPIELAAAIKPKQLDELNLNISVAAVTPNVNLNIPTPSIVSFGIVAPDINPPTVFQPIALDQVSMGFAQGDETGFNVNNEVLGNGNATSLGTTTISIGDATTVVGGSSFNYNSWNDLAANNKTGTIVAGTYIPAIPVNGQSHQAFLNALAGSYTIAGNWVFENKTGNPKDRNGNYTNTVRFVSVNHAYGDFDKKTVFNLTGNVNIFGRSDTNPLTVLSGAHMTVGIEHQSYGGLPAKGINNGTMILEKYSAKNGTVEGTHLIGLTPMVENYIDYHNRPTNTVPSTIPQHLRNTNVWESTLENRGTIKINSTKSIGYDFAQFGYTGTTPSHGSIDAFFGKPSLNIYAVPGNIEVNNKNNYGLRVANIFTTQDANGSYFDETVIDGGHGTITLNGEYNVGVSIARIISGSDKVIKYQKTQPGNSLNDVGRPNYGTDPSNTDDAPPAVGDDLIGNVYNLQVKVDGKNNIGFLRKSDYMNGVGYSALTKNRAEGDFVLTDSHIRSMNFADTSTNSVLIRTDKYGINLAMELNVDGINDATYSLFPNTSKPSNVVLLANETQGGTITTPTKVINSSTINLGYGASAATQNGLIGMMANDAGQLENKAGSTINVNAKKSVGIVVNKKEVATAIASNGINSGDIIVNGEGSTGILNQADFTMNGGNVKAMASNSIGIYAMNTSATITSPATTTSTNLQSGLIEVGMNALGLYADNYANIDLYAGLQLKVNNGGLLFYNYDSVATTTITGQFGLNNGDVSATLEPGGIALYLKNPNIATLSTDIANYLGATFTGANKLNLTMKTDSSNNLYSKLFVLDSPTGGALLLSTIGSTSSSVGALGGKINIDPSSNLDYKMYSIYKGELQIDKDVALDNNGSGGGAIDDYYKVEFLSSKVTVDAGKTLTGTKVGQIAIAQKNYLGSLTNQNVKITNNGMINQSGQGSTGIVTDFGYIHNTVSGVITETGNTSYAIVGARGTEVVNDGTINLDDGASGIVGINFLGFNTGGSEPGYGTNDINITHNGVIKSIATSANPVIAIAAINDSTLGLPHTSIVTLGNGSLIDLNQGKKNTAVYLKETALIDNGGSIEIGEDSTGIFAQNSPLITTSATGYIKSNSIQSVGIYSNGSVINNKYIELTGVGESIGVYVDGSTTTNITNNATITLGNSSDLNKPNIGLYNKTGDVTLSGTGVISVGANSLGIYSTAAGNRVDLLTGSNLNIGSNAIGVYKNGGAVDIAAGTVLNIGLTTDTKSKGVYAVNGVTITNLSDNITMGKDSFGFILEGAAPSSFVNNTANAVELVGEGSVFAYSSADGSTVTNRSKINIVGNEIVALYAKGNTTLTNDTTGTIDMTSGVGNVGMYSVNNGAALALSENKGSITVGKSDVSKSLYSIGMAGDGNTHVKNDGTIKVTQDQGIGMYGVNGAIIENTRDIILDASSATPGSKIMQQVGIYVEGKGTKAINWGVIKTAADYTSNDDVSGIIGVAVLNGAELENHGQIYIDANSGVGAFISGTAANKSIIKNYGDIIVTGTGSFAIKHENGDLQATGNISANGSTSNAIGEIVNEPGKNFGNITFEKDPITKEIVIIVDGKKRSVEEVINRIPEVDNIGFSNIGVYIDTLGKTKPISTLDASQLNYSGTNDLIIGVEAADGSNAKTISIGRNILDPFNLAISSISKFDVYSGSLTWAATYKESGAGIEEVVMTKIPYTTFSSNDNMYNFTEGLEQRYDKNPDMKSREKLLFNKLNSIGNNEEKVLAQAFDNMFGYQYSNVQQRILASGSILDDGVKDLFRSDTLSKESNKVKMLGGRNEYKIDTAGVFDYKQTSAGIVYLNQNESVKLGDSIGWYVGALYDEFKLDDGQNSKEKVMTGKIGMYKSTAFDNNNSLNWTIKGDITGGYHKMDRKYLVIDEVFEAKGNYYSYGLNITNEISKMFRISESVKIGPVASLELGYGKYTDIKEDKGQMKLEVKGNDYYTIKPALGGKIAFDKSVGSNGLKFKAELTAAVEQELGETTNVENQVRVRDTTAGYYKLPKDKREKTNGKVGLNLELGTSRLGFTLSGEYNTEGQNSKVGAGIKISF